MTNMRSRRPSKRMSKGVCELVWVGFYKICDPTSKI